ncbi:MAG: Fic family protein, partial [Chloroflexi bacterium]|nr:Fic family protein [Chloroflexota bacterium]
IEGTRTSLPDLYAYEAGQLPLFELPEDVREVKNHVRALEYGLQRLETLPLSLRLLREIHGVLMEGVRGEHLTPGEFRRSQNWIGPPGCTLSDSVFVPPPVAEMTGALAELETFLHGESDLPTLVRLGLIHYQFEAIHPFLDGNGRMGRLLVVLLLCTWGLLPAPLLYLSEYLEARRPLYYDLLLAVSQRGAWTEWLEFFLQGLAVQAGDAIVRAGRLMDLRESYRKRLQTGGASVGLLRLVDVLFSSPILSISHIAGELRIAFPTAMRYVGSLERLGILHEVTGRKRDRLYRADEILAAITDPSP